MIFMKKFPLNKQVRYARHTISNVLPIESANGVHPGRNTLKTVALRLQAVGGKVSPTGMRRAENEEEEIWITNPMKY